MKQQMIICLMAGVLGVGVAGAEENSEQKMSEKTWFDRMDVNGDEKISVEEYVHFGTDYMKRRGRKVDLQKIEQCFMKFDRDHNGFISPEEFDVRSMQEECSGRIDAVTVKVIKESDRSMEELSKLNKKTGIVTIISTTTRTKSETPEFTITVFNTSSRPITYALEWYCLAKAPGGDAVFIHDKGNESIRVDSRRRVRHCITARTLATKEITIEKERDSGHISDPCVVEEGETSAGYVVLLKHGDTVLDKKASSENYLSEQWISTL